MQPEELRRKVLNDFSNEILKHEKVNEIKDNEDEQGKIDQDHRTVAMDITEVDNIKDEKRKLAEILFKLPHYGGPKLLVTEKNALSKKVVKNGYCLLLYFPDIWQVEGKHMDIEETVDSIQKTFQSDLHFKVDVRKNLTHIEFTSLMSSLTEKYREADCLVVYLVTHCESECKFTDSSIFITK